MKTKKEYEEDVSGPGKFEACEAYAPYFNDAVMLGDGEWLYPDGDENPPTVQIEITQDDVDFWKEEYELTIGHFAYVYEDSNGFIYCTIKEEDHSESPWKA